MSIISRAALRLVIPQFQLDPQSNIHGAPHWARVANNGKALASLSREPVSLAVIEWFAYLHDSQRLNDYEDWGHGPRAAAWAWTLFEQGQLRLSRDDLLNLQFAMAMHSTGQSRGVPLVVAICWDADRLDLGRVGIQPDPQRMATRMGIAAAARLREKA